MSIQIEEQVSRAGALFVGRAKELGTFQAAFERMLEGRRQIITLAGEPGIGKTRLAEAFAEEAEGRGTLVFWGRCYEEPGAPPYWPWVQVLRDMVSALSPGELRLMMADSASQIAVLVPEAGRAAASPHAEPLPDEVPVSHEVPAELGPGRARFGMFDAIARFLLRTAEQVPLVLILDNVHWADGASLALLEFLNQALLRSRVLITCTYRDTEIARGGPLIATLGALSGGAVIERCRLGGLDRSAVALLARRMLGSPLQSKIVDTIDAQTDGNPLFVIELLKELVEEQREAGTEPIAVRIPDGVRETIGRRLNRLPDEVNEILRVASVLGRSFEARELAQVAGDEIEVVLGRLHVADAAGLLECMDEVTQAYRFTHALIRETLYDEIATPERLQLHGRVAETLSESDSAQGRKRLTLIAHHYFESAATGHAARAADYAMRAGHEAMRMDAYEEAVVQYDNALNLMTLYELADFTARREASFWKSRALHCVGDVEGAVRVLIATISDGDNIDDAEWLAELLPQWVVMSSDRPQERQLPLLRRILESLPEGDSASRAKALVATAFAERTLGSNARIQDLVTESVEMARRLGDPIVLCNCLRSAFFALNGNPGTLESRLKYGAEFLDCARDNSDARDNTEWLADACYQQSLNLSEAGRIDELVRLLGNYRNLKASRIGLHLYRSGLLEIMVALLRGDYAGLEQRIERLHTGGGTSRSEDAAGVCAAQMFTLHRDRGTLRQFAGAIEQFLSMATERVWEPGLMLALVEVGNRERAAKEFERLARDEFRSIPSDDMRLTSLIYCSETCVVLGDAQRAQTLYDLLLPYAGTFANHPTAVNFGSVHLYLGMLASSSTGIDAAREHFVQAIDANNSARAWPWLARSYYQFALAIKRAGDPSNQQEARQLLSEAEQIANSIGMTGLVANIDRELRDRDTSATYPDALTAREVDVLRLLAIGRSNKDIAKVLSISLNTVATHVRNILTKTECANRTEAAAYALRHQLTETR